MLARALRANRDYLLLLGEQLAAAGRYEGKIIDAKRAAEKANSTVFSSLQRMSGDPKTQQAGIEAAAAALANGNQRMTRALTVVALHLTPDTPLARPELARLVATAGEALEALAARSRGRRDSTAPGSPRWQGRPPRSPSARPRAPRRWSIGA